MEIVEKLDEWLIDAVAQPFTILVSKHTPITGLHVAQFLMIGAGFAIGLGEILNTIWDFNFKSIIYLMFKPLDFVFGLLISAFAFLKAKKLQTKIDALEGRVGDTSSSERLTESGLRAVGLMMIALFIVSISSPLSVHNPDNKNLVILSYWISLAGTISLTAGLYLNACTQPPRKQKKVYRTNFAFSGLKV